VTSIPHRAVVRVSPDPADRAAAPLAGQRAVVVTDAKLDAGPGLFLESEDGTARAFALASDVEPVTDGCAVAVDLSPGMVTASTIADAMRRARAAYIALHGDPLGPFPTYAGPGEYRATTPDGARYAAVRVY